MGEYPEYFQKGFTQEDVTAKTIADAAVEEYFYKC